ncbi:MAG: serine hydrolase [Polyangiaceae bacterium]|nr:serine hydrolase [Polyangiaceae bacterium]
MRAALSAALLALLAGCGAGDSRAASSTEPPPPSPSAAGSAATPIDAAAAAPAGASASPTTTPAAEPWLEKTLRAADPRWTTWLAQAEALRLQILVTEVGPDGALTSHPLRADAEYFYPASAIKTLLAISALRVLSKQAGGDIDLSTKIERCREDRPGCEPPEEDIDKKKYAADGKPKHDKLRVGAEIHKLLSYSDNDSYNRLWDIVGHRELNEQMVELGLPQVRFHHRMSAPADKSRGTPRVVLLPPGKKPLTAKKRLSDHTLAPTPAPKLEVGSAYRDGKGVFASPMSFAEKNFISLKDLQRVNVSLLLPGHPDALALGLSGAQREHLIRAMTVDLSAKKRAGEHAPLSLGLVEVLPAKELRYVAKSGRAYGFHLDNAYVEHLPSKRAFFVTAVVYANEDGVLNDDDYDYDELSKPLLGALGAALAKSLLGDR